MGHVDTRPECVWTDSSHGVGCPLMGNNIGNYHITAVTPVIVCFIGHRDRIAIFVDVVEDAIDRKVIAHGCCRQQEQQGSQGHIEDSPFHHAFCFVT